VTPIKIIPENAEAIEAALREVNGKAAAHAYTSYAELTDLVDRAQSILSTLLYKKDWQGARWTETSGGKTANSYKYMRDATRVIIERRSSAWYMIEARHVSVGTRGGGEGRLSLTSRQDEAAKKRLAERYWVYG
jgi:hypothetical protein